MGQIMARGPGAGRVPPAAARRADEYWAGRPDALDEHGRVAMCAGGPRVERAGRRLIDAGLGPASGPIGVAGEPVGVAGPGALPDTVAALGVALARGRS